MLHRQYSLVPQENKLQMEQHKHIYLTKLMTMEQDFKLDTKTQYMPQFTET